MIAGSAISKCVSVTCVSEMKDKQREILLESPSHLKTLRHEQSKTRLRSKVFSLERLWIKLLALKGFGLVGSEYKTTKNYESYLLQE